MRVIVNGDCKEELYRPTTFKEVNMKLNNGDLFPSVSGPIRGGGKLTIPEELKQEWNVVLFYRGHW